jgi:hypothetical protein
MKTANKLYALILFILSICVIFSGCGTSPKPVSSPAESTPAAATTPLPAETPTPQPTPEDPYSGWNDFTAEGFQLKLPGQWAAVDAAKDGVNAILEKVQGLDSQWVQEVTAMVTTDGIRDIMRFWAMDTQQAGRSYATANITYQAIPSSVTLEEVCTQVESTYENMDVSFVNNVEKFNIQGLDAARFELKNSSGSSATHEYQYYFLRDGSCWLLTLAVDDAQWDAYEPIFAQIAESFKADAGK